MNREYELDKIDKQILSILMKDGRATYAEIAALLNVSGGTIHVRMKKLEQLGVIKGMHLIADYRKLGYTIYAYIAVNFTTNVDFDEICAKMADIPEVSRVDVVTGEYNAMLQVVCRDASHLNNILKHRIHPLKGVGEYRVFTSLQNVVDRKIDLIEIEKQKVFEL
jgi:Lrp/AsnC family transcriptional regulator for asnA, asnC and gidA